VNAGAEVVVEHVVKAFDDGRIHALDGVSFRISAGEFVALTGPSHPVCRAPRKHRIFR
jgi:ABC-type sugar transport system ATPase subunit